MRREPQPSGQIDPGVAEQVKTMDPLTATDRAAIDALTQPELRPNQIFPDDTPQLHIIPALELCCGALKVHEIGIRKINPLAGRLMSLVRQTEVFRKIGYTSFNAFCQGHLRQIGYHRSSTYVAMRLVESHPTLILQDWIDIGIERLVRLNKICQSGDPSYHKYIEAARTMRGLDFSIFLEKQGLIESGDTTHVPVVFHATRTVRIELDKFTADPRVHEIVGSSNTGRIIEGMIQECSAEWLQEEPKALRSGVAWRCEWCRATGPVDLRAERTLDGINRMVADAHRDISGDCEFADQPGELVIYLDRG